MAKARALVADDEPHIRRILQFLLEREGYEVILAENGDDAWDILSAGRADLALLDTLMPGKDFVSILKLVRTNSDTARLPIILVTSKGEEQDKVRGLRAGANDYIIKPFNSDELILRIGNILGALQREREALPNPSPQELLASLVKLGESQTLEFKETLSLDVRKGTKESYIETSALKTVAAFLNSYGGVLLVGVNDTGDVVGLEREIAKFHKGSSDRFLLHFKNLLKRSVGEQWYPLIDYTLIEVDGDHVLQVNCSESKSPCFINNEMDFYVRINPATDKLEGRKLIEYIQKKFKGR